MDPDRVRAYLQISCAGLGFDIGELWWTCNKDEDCNSSLVAIDEKKDATSNTTACTSGNSGKKLRFEQLYTSKSYANRRSMLVRPSDEEENNAQVHGSNTEDSTSDLEKHVLSPTLVDAISITAQVVWAHTKKVEGLTGRSDIRLQTAVGMPVAIDKNGNMCVVVMYSPNNISSTDDALEYLQSICRSATSTSIPALLPAFDPKRGLISLPNHHHLSESEKLPLLSHVLSEGVSTRFVPLDENHADKDQPLSLPEVHSDHDLENAPRDCFGIPMLPSIAGIGSSSKREDSNNVTTSDVFDEASYGVWSTIMLQAVNTIESIDVMEEQENGIPSQYVSKEKQILTGNTFHYLDIERQERLEEFASAFLDVSIFDLAEVWAPTGQNSDFLGLNSSIKCLDKNASLNKFTRESEKCRIKFWSGAVGRAFSSGNPVWSYNKEAFSDSVRRHLLQEANVETVLAVPVFSGRSKSPAFVFCCYSFVRSGSVPFVLKFVQQALQLLWGGLDNVQPHRSAGEDIWKNVAPADLGEMAADVEMHEHFMFKKRPIGAISDYAESQDATNTWQESNGRTYNTMKAMVDTNPITQHLSTNVHSLERAHVFVQKFVDTSTQPLQQPQQEVLQQHQQQSEQNIRSYHTLVQEEHRHYYQQKNITTPVTSNPLPLSRPFALPREVIHPKSNKGASSTLHKTHTIYESQKGDSGIPMTFNSAQRQLFENNTKKSYSTHAKCLDSNGFSYSISSAQPKHQDPLPCPVYSVSIGETCILATPASSVEPTSTNLSNKFSRTNKLCHIQGCDDIALARRPYCARHKGNRTCEKEGCSKCAQGSTRFCIAHGGGRRCTFPGCDKGARDKFFCAAHGGGKRCKFEGCRKSAVGGSNLCTAHGGGRRCAVEGCDKSAQSSTKFCVKHGGGKKCSHLGCEKVSRGRTQFCAAHGGGVRCKLAGCNRIAIGKVQLCKAHGRTITALLPLDVGAFTTTTIVAASTVSSVLTTASSAASSLLSSRTTQYAPSTTRRSAAVVASAVDKDESAASEEEDEDNDIINFDDEKEQQEHRRSATATNSYDKFTTDTITHNSDTNVNGKGMALLLTATTKHQAMPFSTHAATDADTDSFVNGKKGKDPTAASSTCSSTAFAPFTVQHMENNNKGRMISSSSPFDLESNNPTLLVAPTKAAAIVATSSVAAASPSLSTEEDSTAVDADATAKKPAALNTKNNNARKDAHEEEEEGDDTLDQSTTITLMDSSKGTPRRLLYQQQQQETQLLSTGMLDLALYNKYISHLFLLVVACIILALRSKCT